MSRKSPVHWSLRKESTLPLYQQIMELVMGHIQAGRLQPGDALPSYPWLSKKLEVADKTVRQAYNALGQAGVLEISRGRGTFVAAGPGQAGQAGGRSGPRTATLGVIPPPLPVALSTADLFWSLQRAVQEVAFAEHLDTLLLARAGDLTSPHAPLQVADRKRMDGLVILADAPEPFLRGLASTGLPLVLADSTLPDGSIDSVLFDHIGAARELTYRLVGLGHRQIAYIGLPRGRRSRDSETGFRHAMGTAGLAVKPEWIVKVDLDLGESGLPAVEEALSQGVTAAVAYNAALARAVASAAGRMGRRIPAELSVAATVSESGLVLPGGAKLTAAVFDAYEMGRRAVELLSARIRGENPVPRREVVEARKEDGESVAPPPI